MATFRGLLFAATVAAQGTQYGNNHVIVGRDSQTVEQLAFPAPNVTLYSPAFMPNASFDPGWAEGTEGATSQEDLSKSQLSESQYRLIYMSTVSFLTSFAAKNSAWATSKTAEFLSEEGASFPYVHLAKNSTSTGEKVRIWIQASVHGNEPAGDEAVLAFLGALDADPAWAAEFLEKLEIILLPRYNPDGNACKSSSSCHGKRKSCLTDMFRFPTHSGDKL
jgi:hypothetical protein